MTDNDVIEYFSKWKQIPWKRIDSKYKEYLINRFKDITVYNDDRTYKEAYYRIINHIEIIPKCSICGHNCKSYIYYFASSCGNIKCSAKIQHQTYINNLHNKYGENINNYAQLEYVKEKTKNTCLQKYGTTSPLGNREIWEQTRKHTIEKYGAAYNKEKLNETLMNKYGVKWFTQSKKLIDKAQSLEAKEKQYKTKKKNHSFNISYVEEKSYVLLKEKYSDIVRQYKSDVYPYCCDFYIPSLDLYIECNYHWTHGGHQYNENNKNDIAIVNKWKEKNTKFYNNAIKTWTILDVDKQNTAKNNNLNYLIFYNIFELENWLNGKN